MRLDVVCTKQNALRHLEMKYVDILYLGQHNENQI